MRARSADRSRARRWCCCTTTGAKTGKTRTNPLAYLPDGDRIVIFASKAGAPTNPAWYHNLVAHPEATVEVGGETRRVRAGRRRRAGAGPALRRSRPAACPGFGDYQAKTDRVIPVIALVTT